MSDHAQELAALYCSGAMNADERDAFEAEISAGNAAFAQALAELQPAAAAMAALIEPVNPDPDLRADVLAAATDEHDDDKRQVWRDWSGDADTSVLFTLYRDEGAWEDTGVDGIEVRRLFIDRENNRMTALFRMAPGSAYVPHVHSGAEECFVLEGDLHVGDDIVMRAGDYQRAPAGSTHGVQRTEGGCVILVTSAIDDEVI